MKNDIVGNWNSWRFTNLNGLNVMILEEPFCGYFQRKNSKREKQYAWRWQPPKMMNFSFLYCFAGESAAILVYLTFLKFRRKPDDDGILSGSSERGRWGKWDKMEIFKSTGFSGSESTRVRNTTRVNSKHNLEIDLEVANLMKREDGENRTFEIDIEPWFDIITKPSMGLWHY